jgi:hypothetical protein
MPAGGHLNRETHVSPSEGAPCSKNSVNYLSGKSAGGLCGQSAGVNKNTDL